MKHVLIPVAALCLATLAPRHSVVRASAVPDPVPSREPARPVTDPPNILLIVLDDVGIDKLAMYDQTPGPFLSVPYECDCDYSPHPNCPDDEDLPIAYAPTPNLERLANGEVMANGVPIGGGIRFTNFYANPVCSPTRACLMTGRYAFRTGIGFITDNSEKLQDAETFLPELLKDGLAGSPYEAGAFGKWHLTSPQGNDTHPVDNGFDLFQGHMTNMGDHYVYRKVTSQAGTPPTVTYQGINGTIHPDTQAFTPSSTPTYDYRRWNGHIATGDAKAWINAQTTPFFAYVCYNPPHTPYQLPPFNRLSQATQLELGDIGNCMGSYSAGMKDSDFLEAGNTLETVFYRAMLEAVDTEIGRLIDGIDPDKLANTMIFVVGDNGAPGTVLDHNKLHGKGTVYEWGTHVPLIVCGPQVTSAGSNVSTGLVEAVDLWRTIADVAGASVTAANPITPLDSISFQPMIENPASLGDREVAFCQYFTPNGAYEPTDEGPYVPGPPFCNPPPPNDFCERRELTGHIRSVTDGVFRYVRLQATPSIDGFPQGAPDTPPTYTQQFFRLYDSMGIAIDNEETNNLFSAPGAYQANLDALKGYMLDLSGD